MMVKLLPFWIIHFAHALYLFQVLSIVQQTGAKWELSVKKAAPWRNSLPQNLETAFKRSISIVNSTESTGWSLCVKGLDLSPAV